MKDPYQVLEVARGADDKAIKEAYRRMARKYHPDVNPGNAAAEEKFKEIQGAYETLSDPRKREAYDRFGEAGFGSGAGPGGGPWGGFPGGVPSFDEIFGAGSLEDIFAGLFGRQRPAAGRRRRPAARAEEFRATIEVSFEEALRGADKEITVARQEPCPSCQGSGAASAAAVTCRTCMGSGLRAHPRAATRPPEPCHDCAGTGRARGTPCTACGGSATRTVSERNRVRIPPGIEDGATLRVRGKGPVGPAGTGDLLLVVRVLPDPRFERQGADLLVDLPVTLTEAALGAEVPVPTPEGEARIRLAAGTPSGRKIRLSARGMPQAGGRGDLYAVVRIVPSPNPNAEERRLLEQLATVSHFNPRRRRAD